jgi:hypothetical protein
VTLGGQPVALFALVLERDQDLVAERASSYDQVAILGGDTEIHATSSRAIVCARV